MSMALFTDEMLFAFMVPLLPYIFENRLGLDTSLTQRLTSIFLVEGALISIVSSPFIGNIADRASSKKVLLLVLLVLTLISVLCLSITTSLTGLFIGRFFQCIVSNALFIVGMATMAENIGSEHMGKIAGLTSTIVSAGTCAGPVIAGFLFGFGGYWTAWGGAALFLVVDIIMRLLMIERPQKRRDTASQPHNGSLCAEEHRNSEAEPLLNGDQSSTTEEIGGWRFYVYLFRQPRFTAGIVSYFVFALFIASFESTIAMHARDTFGWGVFPVGLLFASIQGPGMILAPLVGLLKDRVGSKVPTTIGFISIAPFLWVLGVAGDERFPWATLGTRGKIIYGVCTTMIGCFMCLLMGVGTMEATSTVDELENLHPGIFGLYGGYSRAVAITNMSWMSGLLVGPILAGFMVERFGYLDLQCVLAVTSLLASVNAAFNLSSASPQKEECGSDFGTGEP
ncbi:Major facilitator superfamily domain, general substrate transporter [Penicillium griseofulvum]|uniref:Major facilitator superfamily domain, general substrate transporter n=1 Tax=Penicillium patulum TaxID=5078 RepID=A0A135LLL7_PENPA|nr:Major facilitator superfamily domain, general substrate transporter [Penicillium griseofulvum]KXG49863.1 Major facilitator superfamily domain, general substrate transporter [Penicillium griseofulvum]